VSNRIAGLFTISTLAVGLAAVVVAPAGAATTTFYLNSYNPVDASGAFCSGANLLVTTTPPGCGNSVTAPVVLASGSSYSVLVTGAVSAWGAWPFRRCGKPDPSSQFGSPGIANVPAGDDAQFRFAIPLSTGKCAHLPKKTSIFQVNLGSGWVHPVASGNPAKPSGDGDKAHDQHPYTFTFTGEGIAPQFRFIDYHASDNSGQFKIVISG
jgi:hypothetical protein